MQCFELPDGAQPRHLLQESQVLRVESGLIAVVDPLWVDELLGVIPDPTWGRPRPDSIDFTCTTEGFFCGTGGEGSFEFTTHVRDDATLAVEVGFTAELTGVDRWIPAGIVRSGSGNLLVGDPYYLREYLPESFRPPFAAPGPWGVFHLPGPGWAAVHVLKRRGRVEHANLAVRADWVSF